MCQISTRNMSCPKSWIPTVLPCFKSLLVYSDGQLSWVGLIFIWRFCYCWYIKPCQRQRHLEQVVHILFYFILFIKELKHTLYFDPQLSIIDYNMFNFDARDDFLEFYWDFSEELENLKMIVIIINYNDALSFVIKWT